MNTQAIMKPFKLARLCDRKNDLSKRWFVEFGVWDDTKGKVVRKRHYQINKYKTEVERRAAAKLQIKEINKLLQEGYHIKLQEAEKEVPKKDKQEVAPQIHSIQKAFDFILKLEMQSSRKKTYQKGKSILNYFIPFLRPKLYLHQITKQDIIRFSDYLITERKNSPVTRNSYLFSYLKRYFKEMYEREWIIFNPVEGIKRMKEEESKKNRAFSVEQQQQILAEADPQLSLSIKIMYNCFMRPNEIRLTQLKNIHLSKNQIFIPANISKNKKDGYVTIPPHLKSDLIKVIPNNCDPNFYLIGKTYPKVKEVIPGHKHYSINEMTKRHLNLLRQLKLTDGDFIYYSWKHSGVVAAYNANVKIKAIQLQCRHSSLEMTDRYLKSLGLGDNDDILNLMPEI